MCKIPLYGREEVSRSDGAQGKNRTMQKIVIFFALFEKTMLVCRRKCCTHVDVLRIRVGCSTTRTPLRIARLIVLTTAVTTPRTTPLCAGGCLGLSAPDERDVNFYNRKKFR